MMEQLDKVTELRWGVTNKEKLRLLNRAALAVNNTVTLTIPKLRRFPRSRLYLKHMRDNGIRVVEVGEEMGGDFEEEAQRIGGLLQLYANKRNPNARPTLQQLEQEVLEFLNAEVFSVFLLIFSSFFILNNIIIYNYERTCPVYETTCTVKGKDKQSSYTGAMGGTIHVVAGTTGAKLRSYADGAWPQWSVARNDSFGYVKLTASDHSSTRFEFIHSDDGAVQDAFTITGDYKDIMGSWPAPSARHTP
ncbi:putative inactive purple acid phosphatase 27 [Hordeum vulgare]|nr:putative inactive purple acid phosphatase 27 [Hordeum vulgare]